MPLLPAMHARKVRVHVVVSPRFVARRLPGVSVTAIMGIPDTNYDYDANSRVGLNFGMTASRTTDLARTNTP